MSSQRVFAWLLPAAIAIGIVFPAYAITPVASQDYGLQVTHSELSRYGLESGTQGLELALTITNAGTHNLSDVRFYVVRAGSKTIIGQREPALVGKLAVGQKAVVTWVFDSKQPIVGPIRDVVFRVEAIDKESNNIVTFSQKSSEAH